MLLAVALGGAAGGIARAALEQWRPAGGGWPWTTFLVNIAGAALLAWVVSGRALRGRLARPLLGTGVCGAFTTFATLQVEVVALMRDGRVALAVSYALASIAAGLAAMVVVMTLSRTR